MPLSFALAEDGVIAEMRIAMDDAVAAERQPPGLEQGDDAMALRTSSGAVLNDSSFSPSSQSMRQQARRRQLRVKARHAHARQIGPQRRWRDKDRACLASRE
jgi:hypothetical protein